MVNEFKLTVVHCTPKPDADLCMRVDLPLDKKLWKIRTGNPGRRAIAGRGPLGRCERTCTDLHQVLVYKMDDGEFEFVYHLII